ncbi:MFS transporter [Nocardia sp. SYP-A9097]|uniref:MFS transporter n=1 Tax=Nocardia sp. SYP-A9097 TaxID=2663237 RepID=UPI0013218DDA|nr:MFS transporter [Nocardia sp. SYP-A9097]MRH86215.1 MFS transporter [Nocardia sp. SYP-A9097]
MFFAFTADLIPYYALYALLFADHGLSTAQISSLLVIWSATSFLLEVPSGAWADTVSRRALLILSGVLLTAGFLVWTLLPSYAGFAAGFILWGTAGALRSGTFEALIYDDLVARASTSAYPRLMGYTRAAAESAALIGILAAAPLYAWGGFALVGWSSVVLAGVHVLSATVLPSAPKVVSASDIEDLEEEPGFEPPPVSVTSAPAGMSRYLHMLRSGLRESLQVRVIRRGVVLVALLNGITAFDEYFALLADHAGVSPSISAVLVGVTVAGALAGATLAGRTENASARAFSIALGIGGVLFIGGALLCGTATAHPGLMYPLTAVGFTAIAIGYGIDYNADVLASARLQDVIEGPARATVTSVSGLVTEVIALIVFVFVGVAAGQLPIPALVAVLGTPLLLIAALVPTWLPREVERSPLRPPTAD